MIPKIFVFMAWIMVIGVQVESKANPVEKRSENITKWESYTWDRELNQNNPCKVYNGISTERASGEIICCPNSCGGCGGTGCDNRPGGAENCCGDNIVSSGRICGYERKENGLKGYKAPCYYGICKEEDSKCGIQLSPPKDHGKCCPGFTCGYNGLGAAGRCIKECKNSDDKKYGEKECLYHKQLNRCGDGKWIAKMTEHCSKTCGYCETELEETFDKKAMDEMFKEMNQTINTAKENKARISYLTSKVKTDGDLEPFVNGEWSTWGEYSCCRTGQKTRTRSCNNPSASGGGFACPGLSSESIDCISESCPDPLPNAPGCYIRFPSGCPKQKQYSHLQNKLTWINDDESNSRQQCDAWKQPLNDWCGVNDIIVKYVERK